MYYARNPVRLTFEDADWGTLTDDEESGSERELSSHSLIPANAFIRPMPAEMSPSSGKPLITTPGVFGTAAEVKHCGVELNTEQRQHSTPGKLTWTDSLNQVDQASSLAQAVLPVVTHKDAVRPAQMPNPSCLLSRSKAKPFHDEDRSEQHQSVPRAATIPPKDATMNLPPVFSDSDDECDDPFATRLTTGRQPRRQDGGLEPGGNIEVGRCARSYSDSHPGEVWAMLIAERAK